MFAVGIFEYDGNCFDEYGVLEDEEGCVWTQICSKCFEILNIDSGLLSIKGKAGGLCGVYGCSNEAVYYLDFPDGAKHSD